MEVSNIKEGQTIKNYKQLCQLLNEPVKTGKSKQIQIEEWERYFTFSRSGNKYIINQIYETPLIKFNNKGIYNNFIQLIILDYLINVNKKNNVIITANKLLLYIHMYNENYNYCIQYIPQLSKYTNIQEKIIYDFYNTSYGNFRDSLETGLNNLRSKALLMYEKLIYVCTSDYNHRRATEEEKLYINIAEKEIMNELGYNDLNIIRTSPLWNKFKSMLIQRLHLINIKYHYICYNLTVNREYIENDRNILLQCTLDEIERKQQKQELNYTVMDRLLVNAENRKNNAFTSYKKSKMRSTDTYIKNMAELINLLIDINANDIRDDIQRIVEEEREEMQLLNEIENFFK